MFDIEIVRPSVDEIKQHGPSLNNILKLTQQAFNICHPEQADSTTAKLGQCLDLIAAYYGFNSFGALKAFLTDPNADLMPVQDTNEKVVQKLSSIFGLTNHQLINAYHETLTAYIRYSNLPDSINISTDGHYFNSLLSMRYLHIQPWDHILTKLIKNPHYKFTEKDVYDYSSIDRLVRLNILNNLLPFAKDALKDKKSQFAAPLSAFFGGQITKLQFLNEIAEFFDGKSIGSGLIDARSIDPVKINSPLYSFLLSSGVPERNIYAFEDADNVASLMISFKLMPRLESFLVNFTPDKGCSKLNIELDLISHKQQSAIQKAVQLEKSSHGSAKHILTDMIHNLQYLNPVLNLPKASWYQAEPTHSESQLAWRNYVIDYAESAVPAMIAVANNLIIGQRATLKRVYFDENGFLMFNFPKTIQLKPNTEYEQTQTDSYGLSLFINFLFFAKYMKDFDFDLAENIHFRLMRNYINSVFPPEKVQSKNTRGNLPEYSENETQSSSPIFLGYDASSGARSYLQANKCQHFAISGQSSRAYHKFENDIIESRLSGGRGMYFIDGSGEDNKLDLIKSILKKMNREHDLIVTHEFDFDVTDSLKSNRVIYIPIYKYKDRNEATAFLHLIGFKISDVIYRNMSIKTIKSTETSMITHLCEDYIQHESWGLIHESSAAWRIKMYIFHFCRDLTKLPEYIFANTSHKLIFKSDNKLMCSQIDLLHTNSQLYAELVKLTDDQYLMWHRGAVSRYTYK